MVPPRLGKQSAHAAAEETREETVSGRTYKAFWYVPEVKRCVKSVEEYYAHGGVRSESYTSELESFKLAD